MLWWTFLRLKSGSADVRRRAAQRLATRGNVGAVAPLVERLDDPDPAVQVAALQALGVIRSPTAVEPVAGALRHAGGVAAPEDASPIRSAAAVALGQMGQPGLEALLGAAKDKNARARESAVSALGDVGGEQAEATLASALRDERSQVRQSAARALAKAAGPRVTGLLVSGLSQKDPATRASILEALASVGDGAATTALVEAVRDQERTVREAAVRGLGQVGSKEALEALLRVFEGEARELRAMAADALRPLRWEPVDARQRAVHAVLHEHYAEAAREGAVAVGPLAAALDHKAPVVRCAAAEALGLIRSAEAARRLASSLGDHDETVRSAAVRALARIGPVGVPALLNPLNERAGAVRNAAVDALIAIGDGPALSALVALLSVGRPAPAGPERIFQTGDEHAFETARLAAGTLRRFFSQRADRLSPADLDLVAAVPDLVLTEADADDPAESAPRDPAISCGDLRELARAELARRRAGGENP